MKVLTIIISYNFEKWIRPCLESLLLSTYPTEILVIDNGSKDRTVSTIRQAYPSVRIIDNGQNLGFGKANNIGMQIAMQEGFDAVFLLNQDAWVSTDTIGTLAGLSRENPTFGILSPVHLNGQGNQLDKGFAHYVQIKDKTELPKSKSLIEATFINAAFWFIPITTLKTVGGFSPLFYHYGEDKDYINRLHYHHLKIGYSPKVFGCHDREFREVTRKAYFRSEYVYLLSEYANINRPIGNAFVYSVLACIKKSLTAFFHIKPQDGCTYLYLAIKLTTRTGKVIQVRRKTRKEAPHFL